MGHDRGGFAQAHLPHEGRTADDRQERARAAVDEPSRHEPIPPEGQKWAIESTWAVSRWCRPQEQRGRSAVVRAQQVGDGVGEVPSVFGFG